MKRKALAGVLFMALVATGVVERAAAASSHDESLGDKIKKLFATPTPTPHKKKKSESPKSSASPKASARAREMPEPEETPKKKTAAKAKATAEPGETAAPKKKSTAKAKETPVEEETPAPKSSAHVKKQSSATAEHSPSASPHHKKKETEAAEAEESPTPTKKSAGKKQASPTPEPGEAETAPPSATPTESSTVRGNGAVATISTSEIAGFDEYPPAVRKMIEFAVGLTKQNLGYHYGSDDPANGGMDCSGFVNYVLRQQGMKEVPRDSREQYIWVRKAGTFQAVIGKTDDTFELNALKPGDLLFWTGTYQIARDPNITHTMIYLGRERGSNQRIMVGSSDGRTYKGQSRYGVSIFDFHVARQSRKPAEETGTGAAFVGYGRVPGLNEGADR